MSLRHLYITNTLIFKLSLSSNLINPLEYSKMPGNENSGRRGYAHEIQAKEAIKLSFSTIIKVLKDETIPVDLRLKAAIPLASKYFPDKIEMNDVNQLSGDQKFILLNNYLDKFKTVKVIDVNQP